MSLYKCPFCKYSSINKHNFIKHLNKKKKCYNNSMDDFGTNIFNIVNKLNKNKQLEQDNKKLQQDIKKLKDENKQLKQNITNNIHNGDSYNDNSTNNITLNLNIHNNDGKSFHIKNLNLDNILKQLSKNNLVMENKIISNIQSRRERIPKKPIEYLEAVIDNLDNNLNNKKTKKTFEELKEFINTYDQYFNKKIIDNNKKIFNSYGIEKIKTIDDKVDGNEKIFILKENSNNNNKLEYEETTLKEIYLILQNTLENICNKLINNYDTLNEDNKYTAKIANLRMKIKKKFDIIYKVIKIKDEELNKKLKNMHNYIYTNGKSTYPFTNDYRVIRNLLRNIRNEFRDTWNETKEIKNKIGDKYDSLLYKYIKHIRDTYKGNDLYNEETEIGKLWRNIHRTKNTI